MGKEPLVPPLSDEEQAVEDLLRRLDGPTARSLRDEIGILLLDRQIRAVRAGIRFGVRLAWDLADPPEEIV